MSFDPLLLRSKLSLIPSNRLLDHFMNMNCAEMNQVPGASKLKMMYYLQKRITVTLRNHQSLNGQLELRNNSIGEHSLCLEMNDY